MSCLCLLQLVSHFRFVICLKMVGQRVNAGLSGSSGRSLLLLVTNIVLLVLGALTVASGSIMLTIFLFHLLTFASSLFLVTPILLMTRYVIIHYIYMYMYIFCFCLNNDFIILNTIFKL